MTPHELAELVTSLALGIVSAIVPVVNAETYVVASQVSALAGPVPVAVGVGIGQSFGKLLLFLGVRRGRDFPFVQRHRGKISSAETGPMRQRLRAFVRTLLNLVGTKRWGLPITFVAAVLGVPPLYAVALLAGATRMRIGWFYLAVVVGRVLRFVAVATGAGSLTFWD
ncbi:hypothetical protein GCM10009841_24510 [Microlunatus panaciterrae]|uniref:Membrane protein YqaA with SNARE-associated domain n=1 Tax=Microlunatus panaciterrae TaxID=400768 RepID=A0ABS2RFL2_9ACTN|nr:hypothetical protein [Microlunatus panaciterrae]MBM7797332.1 membrane protein YqaA with SNARE-associated domain [Microlunatus panaciterrae]